MATPATSFFGRQVDLNPVRDSGMDAHGHTFGKKTFHKPTFCHHCTDMLWGFIGQGYICEVCNFVSHDRCTEAGISPCATIAADRIKDPVPHTWSDPGHFRKKFCNVCRRRLDDALSLHCEACEYYTHLGCLDFVVSNCIRFIAYDESKELDKITVYHHWREGNLPTNSRCLVCKKSCATHECLASMKCEWCWATAHSGCFKSLTRECDMGPIRELIIPPWAVSMPVTMNMVKGDIVSRIQDLLATARRNKNFQNMKNARHSLDSLTLSTVPAISSPLLPPSSSNPAPSRSLDPSPTHRAKLNLPQLNAVSKSQGSSPTSPRTLSPSLYLPKSSSPTKGPRPKSAVPCMQSSSKGSGSRMKSSKSFDGGLTSPDIFFSSSKPTSLSNPHLSEPTDDDEQSVKPTLLSQALPLLKYKNGENDSEGLYPQMNLQSSVMTKHQITSVTSSNQSSVSGDLMTNVDAHPFAIPIVLNQSNVDNVSSTLHPSGSQDSPSKETLDTTPRPANGVGTSVFVDPSNPEDPSQLYCSHGMMVLSPTSISNASPPPTPTIAPIPTHPPLTRTSVSMYRTHTQGQRSASDSGLDQSTSEFVGDDDGDDDDACLLQRNGAVRGRPLSTQIICSGLYKLLPFRTLRSPACMPTFVQRILLPFI